MLKDIKIYKYNPFNKTKKQILADNTLKQANKIHKDSFNEEIIVIYDFKRNFIEKRNYELFIAENGKRGNVLAYCYVYMPPKRETFLTDGAYKVAMYEFMKETGGSQCPQIVSFAVGEQYRGKGIGTKLFNEVLENLKNNYVVSNLNVQVENLNALKIYRSKGFLISELERTVFGDFFLMYNFNNKKIKSGASMYYNMLKKVVNNEPNAKLIEDFKKYKENQNIDNDILKLIETSVFEFKKIRLKNKDADFNINDYLVSLDGNCEVCKELEPTLKNRKVYRKTTPEQKSIFENIRKCTETINRQQHILRTGNNYRDVELKHPAQKDEEFISFFDR